MFIRLKSNIVNVLALAALFSSLMMVGLLSASSSIFRDEYTQHSSLSSNRETPTLILDYFATLVPIKAETKYIYYEPLGYNSTFIFEDSTRSYGGTWNIPFIKVEFLGKTRDLKHNKPVNVEVGSASCRLVVKIESTSEIDRQAVMPYNSFAGLRIIIHHGDDNDTHSADNYDPCSSGAKNYEGSGCLGSILFFAGFMLLVIRFL